MASVVQQRVGTAISNLQTGNLAFTGSTPAGRGIICLLATWGDYSTATITVTCSGTESNLTEVGTTYYNATRAHGFRMFALGQTVNAGTKTISISSNQFMYFTINLIEVQDHNPTSFYVREASSAAATANASLSIDANAGDLVVGAIEGATSQAAGAGFTAWDLTNQELFEMGQYRTAASGGSQTVNWTNNAGNWMAKAWVFANAAAAGGVGRAVHLSRLMRG